MNEGVQDHFNMMAHYGQVWRDITANNPLSVVIKALID